MLKRFIDFIFEALDLSQYEIEPGKKKVKIFIGRLMPPHKIHIKRIIDGNITEVFLVKPGAKNADKSPFPFEIQKEMLKAILGNKVNVYQVGGAFIGEITNVLRKEGKEPEILYCGDDRESSYRSMIERYKEELNLDCKVVAFERSGDESISGTDVRKSLINNEYEKFITYMSKPVANREWFEKLRKFVI